MSTRAGGRRCRRIKNQGSSVDVLAAAPTHNTKADVRASVRGIPSVARSRSHKHAVEAPRSAANHSIGPGRPIIDRIYKVTIPAPIGRFAPRVLAPFPNVTG